MRITEPIYYAICMSKKTKFILFIDVSGIKTHCFTIGVIRNQHVGKIKIAHN